MKVITIVVLALGLAFVFAPTVFADGTQSTFDYVGTPFTSDTGSSIAAGTTELTGSFTINGTLPANAVLMPVTPTDFSFSDGFFNWTPDDSNINTGFAFSTDANGNIIGWEIDLYAVTFLNPNTPAFQFEMISSFDQGVGQDSARATRLNDFGPDYQVVSFISGTWTDPVTSAAVTTTPEPPAYLLMLAGLGLIICVSAKRRTSTLSDSENGGLQ